MYRCLIKLGPGIGYAKGRAWSASACDSMSWRGPGLYVCVGVCGAVEGTSVLSEVAMVQSCVQLAVALLQIGSHNVGGDR